MSSRQKHSRRTVDFQFETIQKQSRSSNLSRVASESNIDILVTEASNDSRLSKRIFPNWRWTSFQNLHSLHLLSKYKLQQLTLQSDISKNSFNYIRNSFYLSDMIISSCFKKTKIFHVIICISYNVSILCTDVLLSFLDNITNFRSYSFRFCISSI